MRPDRSTMVSPATGNVKQEKRPVSIFRFIKISVLCMWAVSSLAAADVLYTWEDASGTLHISEKAPPADAQHTHRLDYEPQTSFETGVAEAALEEKYKESIWLKSFSANGVKIRSAIPGCTPVFAILVRIAAMMICGMGRP